LFGRVELITVHLRTHCSLVNYRKRTGRLGRRCREDLVLSKVHVLTVLPREPTF